MFPPRQFVNRAPMAAPLNSVDCEGERCPDYLEPILAWRAWCLEWDVRKDAPVLRSVTYRVRWPARKPMRAHCLTRYSSRRNLAPRMNLPEHPSAPHVQHGCGIYTVKEFEHVQRWSVPPGRFVAGQVKLWGQIFAFTEGYLAEFAYPLSLVVPVESQVDQDLVRLCAERYGLEEASYRVAA